ncbi:MAG: response regulator [Candidatus Omnitrophica bacterium]|nr:response regulator [Candidatus Omnitrophota bacterium]
MKILIADDTPEIVSLMRLFLQKKLHNVDVAENGKQALAMIISNNYDLAFMDHNMPEMTGLELVKYIRTNNIPTKTIILTGYSGMKDFFAKSVGADEYLSKPCELEDIAAILDKYETNQTPKIQEAIESKDEIKPQSAHDDNPQANQSLGKRIMVVDDEPHIVKLIELRLKANGYQVQTAVNGKECLEKIPDFKPDLILLDVMMPVLDGYSTIIAMREMRLAEDSAFPEIPVLVLSARADNVIKEFMEKEEIKGYISKPFKSEELMKKIEEILGKKG